MTYPDDKMDCRSARLHRRRYGVAHRVRAGAALLLLLPSIGGCYRYVPVSETSPTTGTDIAVGISDRGRVALFSQLGPGVRRLRGRLMRMTDSALVLGVSAVEYVGAASAAQWTGEVVSVPREYVTDVGERRLSRTRSWLMAGVVALLAAAVSTIAIGGFGDDAGDNRVPPGNGETQ